MLYIVSIYYNPMKNLRTADFLYLPGRIQPVLFVPVRYVPSGSQVVLPNTNTPAGRMAPAGVLFS